MRKLNNNFETRYLRKSNLQMQGFSIAELSLVLALFSFVTLMMSSMAVNYANKKADLAKNLEITETIQEVQKILADEDRCSRNLEGLAMGREHTIDKLFNLNNAGQLDRGTPLYSTADRGIILRLKRATANNAVTGKVRSTEMEVVDANTKKPATILRTFPLFYTTTAAGNDLEKCSSRSLGDEQPSVEVCNAGSTGAIRYNFAMKNTEVCKAGVCEDSRMTGGSYIRMLTGHGPCREPNPYTHNCSCPPGFIKGVVNKFVNYGCANGVFDTWKDKVNKTDAQVEFEPVQNVADNRCGIEVTLCYKL